VTKRALALSLLPTAAVLLYPPALALSGGASKRVAALMFFYPWLVTSCIWTVLTQSSHIQEDCQRDRTDDDFYRWQIESALDYSRHSRLVPALTAGLNYQTLHHVFPSVCHCHFHDLYPDYAAICAKHGVRLNTRPNILAAWRSCVARVFELSAER